MRGNESPLSGPSSSDELFVRDFIPRVSRTFALAIKFLPPGLRHPVYTAYLLCRVADTIEDSPYIDLPEKHSRLMRLSELLRKAEDGQENSQDDIAFLYESINSEGGDDHKLLLQSSQLFEALQRLPETQRKIIYHWAGEMAKGMADYSQMTPAEDGHIAALKDLAEWDRYCYYVAGTVGQMLTGLFIEHYRLSDDRIMGLNHLANSFGLGLQKVNVIKDVPDDRLRGVCFLPMDIMAEYSLNPSTLADPKYERQISEFVAQLVELTAVHLDDAIAYTLLFPSRYRGVRMFLSVPVLLAIETLNLIRTNPFQTMAGPPVKITRRDVARLVAAAARHSSSNDGLQKYYLKLKNKH